MGLEIVIHRGFDEDKGRILISILVCKNRYITKLIHTYSHVYKLPKFCHLYTFDIVSWASRTVGSCFIWYLYSCCYPLCGQRSTHKSKGSYNEYRQQIKPDPPVRCIIMNFLWFSCILLSHNLIFQAAIRGYRWVSCWRDTSDTLYSRRFCPPYSL